MGRANASPTITMKLACSRSTSSHSFSASSRCSAGITTAPPLNNAPKAIQCAVPCMNGHAGTHLVRAARQRSAISSGEVIGFPPPPAPPMAPKKTSSWRHMTPLGIPVVPPV